MRTGTTPPNSAPAPWVSHWEHQWEGGDCGFVPVGPRVKPQLIFFSAACSWARHSSSCRSKERPGLPCGGHGGQHASQHSLWHTGNVDKYKPPFLAFISSQPFVLMLISSILLRVLFTCLTRLCGPPLRAPTPPGPLLVTRRPSCHPDWGNGSGH